MRSCKQYFNTTSNIHKESSPIGIIADVVKTVQAGEVCSGGFCCYKITGQTNCATPSGFSSGCNGITCTQEAAWRICGAYKNNSAAGVMGIYRLPSKDELRKVIKYNNDWSKNPKKADTQATITKSLGLNLCSDVYDNTQEPYCGGYSCPNLIYNTCFQRNTASSTSGGYLAYYKLGGTTLGLQIEQYRFCPVIL